MTTEATIAPTRTRHHWTKAELAHLNRSASHSKNKQDVFAKIADEMGLSKSTVQSTYYAHRNPSSSVKAMPAKGQSKAAQKPVQPVQSGQPDFTGLSMSELGAMGNALKFEFTRRKEAISEIESIFA